MALNWVQTFMETQGKVPPEVEQGFRAAFTPRERSHILAVHKAMFFSNLSSNTMQSWLNRLRKKPAQLPASCRIDL